MTTTDTLPVIYQSEDIEDAVRWVLSSTLPAPERVLLILLLRNGLRINEICEPSCIKFAGRYIAYVHQRKNKTWRTIATAEAAEWLATVDEQNRVRNWRRNRFYYYRLLRGMFPNVETQRTRNTAVTHAPRNAAAQAAQAATDDIEAVKLSIGDRSQAAAQRYLKTPPRRSSIKQGITQAASGLLENLVTTARGIIYLRKS